MQFDIFSYEEAEAVLRKPDCMGFKFFVSIGEPHSLPPYGFRERQINSVSHHGLMRRLRLEFDDTTLPSSERAGYVRASEEQIRFLLNFLTEIDAPVAFHCAAGISRSSAAALIYVASRLGPGHEHAACQIILDYRPSVNAIYPRARYLHPNKHMIRLADDLLHRGGLLLAAAFEAWPEDQSEHIIFSELRK